jgi:hypothetical protein
MKQPAAGFVAAFALLLAACGNDSAQQRDARPIDGRGLDAREPDAGNQVCGLAVPATTGGAEYATATTFDVEVASPDGTSGPFFRLFIHDGTIHVVASRWFQELSFDGQGGVPVPFPNGAPDTPLAVLDAAYAGSSYGVVALFDTTPVEYRFCSLSTAGVIDSGACTSLTIAQPPRVAFDGANYRVRGVRSGMLHEWVFTVAGTLAGETDIGPTQFGETGVASSFTADSWAATLMWGSHVAGCDTMTAHLATATVADSADVLPTSFDLQFGIAAAQDGDTVGVVFHGECLETPSRCDGSGENVTFFALVDDGELARPAAAVGIPQRQQYASHWDGERLHVAYGSDPWLWLAAVNRDGTIESRSHVPLEYSAGGAYFGDVLASARVGTNDYVIGYLLGRDAGGIETRVARFQLLRR